MSINSKVIKSQAIIFCRLSRHADEKRGIMSLDSQEYAIRQAIPKNLEVFMSIKTTGSAYRGCEPQRQLINVLKKSKNKIVYVYEPNRLSRNVRVFDEIVTLSHQNNHRIFVVTLDRMFEDLNELRPFIVDAERDAYEMGRRVSRTYKYKKSREPAWGKIRNDRDEIVDNPHEQAINRLICLLGNPGSSVSEIAFLLNKVGRTTGKEPFELVEYDRYSTVDLKVSHLPYGMSPKNIADTLKYYEVRHRKRLNWNTREIVNILYQKFDGCVIDVKDDKINEEIKMSKEIKEEEIKDSKKEIQWIYIWYDPTIGLPPNIQLPNGMNLPTYSCELCIPKL